jgi:hypothetical protein
MNSGRYWIRCHKASILQDHNNNSNSRIQWYFQQPQQQLHQHSGYNGGTNLPPPECHVRSYGLVLKLPMYNSSIALFMPGGGGS